MKLRDLNDAHMPIKDRVLNRWVLGATGEEICRDVGLSRPEAASVIVQRARAAGDPRAVSRKARRGRGLLVVRVVFVRKSIIADDFIEEAETRGLTVNELAERLLRHAVHSRIVGAILDDAA